LFCLFVLFVCLFVCLFVWLCVWFVLTVAAVRVRLEEVQFYINLKQEPPSDSSVRRSPEPAPIYDAKGVRVNTREKVRCCCVMFVVFGLCV
jgi:hypothetical protein